MKTEKLYEKDSYLLDFTATVLACEKQGNRFAVLLDRTAFFPEQGGQYADLGSLNGNIVVDVQIVSDEIVHYLSIPLTPGETVCGRVDKETRFTRMQTHTGEHILSGVIHNLYGFDNVGFHLGDGYATVDTSGSMDEEMIEQAEKKANAIVWDDRRVTASFPSLQELQTISFRSKIDLQEGMRLITIDDCDVCACCAPHLSSTGQVGLIKVIRHEPHKGGTRLTILCGNNAYNHYKKTFELTNSILQQLSATPATVLSELSRLTDKLATLTKEIKDLKTEFALKSLSFSSAGGREYAFLDGDFDTMRSCLPEPNETTRFLFSKADDGVLFVVSSCSEDVRLLVKDMTSALGGKGGGKPSFAQGKLTSDLEKIVSFLENL